MKTLKSQLLKKLSLFTLTISAIPLAIAQEASINSPVTTNGYGIRNVWSQGDIVTNLTIIILVIMSISSWYISITKLIEQRKIMSGINNISPDFWKDFSNNNIVLSEDPSDAFKKIARDALHAKSEYKGDLTKNIAFDTWIELAVTLPFEELQEKLGNGMNFLATIGSTAPFVGLFGTVWGIYHALTAIGTSGESSIEKIAGPIGEALIMTALGLAVAVPAVFCYNWLQKRNKNTIDGLHRFSSKVEKVLLGGSAN